MMKIVVLSSSRGTLFQHLLDRKYPIAALVSDDPFCEAFFKSKANGVPTKFSMGDTLLGPILQDLQPDLIILAGYKRRIPAPLIELYKGKMINVHPAVSSRYDCMFDRKIHEAVIENQDEYFGVRIHYVDKEVDTGKTIASLTQKVLPTDTSQTLRQKVQEIEKRLLCAVIDTML